jgi:hypothetical protein
VIVRQDGDVKLGDAIKQAESLVPKLKGNDAVAVHVLAELARRVSRLQRPIRQLADGLSPKLAGLTQETLFREDP